LTTHATLVCLNADKGEVIWQRDLIEDFAAQMMLAKGQWEWKFAESPLVDGNQVIVTPGTREAAMVALDTKTGNEIWRCQLPEIGEKGCDGAGYSSAVISHACGVKQYVQLTGRGVIGVEAASGKFLWGYNGVANDIANISSPAIIGDRVFASTGYQTGSALLHLTKDDSGVFTAEEQYFLDARTFQNHHGGFVVNDGMVFGGHGHKMGLPICIRLDDGEVMWGPIRNDGMASAACCMADGHLYFRYQNGLMVLVEATDEGYREKGSFMIPDVRSESWSHPVISGGRLYLK
jgi:outer membrane protein assembly factor BamB